MTDFPEYDVGISFLYTHKVPKSEFAVPYKWINFHPAPLPEFRGCHPYFHAIMQGLSTFGSSVHYMDAEFDTGEIIEVIRFPIEPHNTAGDLITTSRNIALELFKRHIPSILQGKVRSYPQGDGRYYGLTKINDHVDITDSQAKKIRALTVYPHHLPLIDIGGRTFKIVPTDGKSVEVFRK
jgi:methionyl-tRNA formyltransferase